MLSRLALNKGFSIVQCISVSQKTCQTTLLRALSNQAPASNVTKDGREILNIKEGPERDLVNFPRLKRPLYPGKVRLGFIPDEWFQFFYERTGVTGPYLFGAGLFTYLYSKEILIMEHEFYTGLAILVMIIYAQKKFGKDIAKALDDEVDKMEKSLTDAKDNVLNTLKENIKNEEKAQWQLEGQKLLFEAKRENVFLQLEAEFRRRQLQVYNEVKRRLDYQLEVQNVKRNIQQRHMVNWIVNSVVKSITPQQEKETLQKCISDLKGLAAKV